MADVTGIGLSAFLPSVSRSLRGEDTEHSTGGLSPALNELFEAILLLKLINARTRARASSRFVTTGMPNSAAFLRITYSSRRINRDSASLSWLGMLMTSLISLVVR